MEKELSAKFYGVFDHEVMNVHSCEWWDSVLMCKWRQPSKWTCNVIVTLKQNVYTLFIVLLETVEELE